LFTLSLIMRILHLSDFHLDKTAQTDTIRHIVTPLIATITEQHRQIPFNLIVFTGDAINQCGKSYTTSEEAYNEFQSIFVTPILTALNLQPSQFFFVPGNHDIDRTADKPIIETGLVHTLLSTESVNDFIQNPQGVDRMIPFKSFESTYYENPDVLHGLQHNIAPIFGSTFKLEVNNKKVGIACLNSAWRSHTRSTEDGDKGLLWIGEKQLLDSVANIEDCEIKIALSHYPIDWLHPEDIDVANKILRRDFNLLFCGHTHSTTVYYTASPEGNLFSFCAPGILSANIRAKESAFYNGFTIIDYRLDQELLTASFFSKRYLSNIFAPNTQIADAGRWEAKILVGDEIRALNEVHGVITNIKTDCSPENNHHLISHSPDTQAPKSINEIFVMPTLSMRNDYDIEKEEKDIESLHELLSNKGNFVIFGTKESGKTVLLDKILLELLDNHAQYQVLPVWIDFNFIKSNVVSDIRSYWSKSIQETKKLLESNEVILLIDNFSFDSENKRTLNAIRQIMAEYPRLRFIATSPQLFEHQIPVNPDTTNIFSFQTLTINQFKTKQIKELIKKWFSRTQNVDAPVKLEGLTNAFLALNLPRTPFAISMYLWIIEKQEQYRPINNAVLIENYLEKLLNKHGVQEGNRDRFDYNNKQWLLSAIAKEMLDKDAENYALGYEDFKSFIAKYLNLKKLDQNSDKIIEELFNRGIFVHHNGYVRFRFSCFFEFFLAIRMRNSSSFCQFILDERNYLKFVNEIDYYTGLQRGETDVLRLLMDRLEKGFSELKEILAESEFTIDDFFATDHSLLDQLTDRELGDIVSEKPTETQLEEIEDRRLSAKDYDVGIAKKKVDDNFDEITKLLVLSLRVIRNSEEVEEENLKSESYNKAIEYSILYAIVTKWILIYLRQKSESMPHEEKNDLILYAKHLPLIVEGMLSENIGTTKLSVVMQEKIENDKRNLSVSDLEKFISVFLFADIRAGNYQKVISDFIKTNTKKYLKEMIFWKLVTYYYNRSKTSESDNFYLNNIADLIVANGGKRRAKGEIIESFKKRKETKNFDPD
jgi:predicted MPP superfamily phosphohydrolase